MSTTFIDTILWGTRVVIVLFPVGLYYFTIFVKEKRKFQELIEDGQVCFITFSIAASSFVNILAMLIKENATILRKGFGVIILIILVLLSAISTNFYNWFNTFNEEENQEAFNKDRKGIRNLSIFILLGTTIFFSFIADVFLCG